MENKQKADNKTDSDNRAYENIRTYLDQYGIKYIRLNRLYWIKNIHTYGKKIFSINIP